MAVIDIGPGATDRVGTWTAQWSGIDKANPANDTGVLDTFETWCNSNVTGMKMGTFSGSGTSWTLRDYETLGNVSSGSKQTFTGKNCDVVTNDCLGLYYASGYVDSYYTGGSGAAYASTADRFATPGSWSLLDNFVISIYATGTTVAAGSLPLKNVFGRPFSGVFR